MAAVCPDPVTHYAREVVGGAILAGRLVRLAAARHLHDLEHGHERGLKWDVKAAKHILQFAGYLRFSDGAFEGKPFIPQPFQAFKLGCLFGWKNADGNRRFRTAYIEEAKGQGKTPCGGLVLLYGAVADGEGSAECFSAATAQHQAAICFRDAKLFAQNSPSLSNRITVGQANLAYEARNSFIRPVSAEHRGLDGKRPHIAVVDELHEHPTDLVVEKMRAGTKNRRQPMIFEITNSGYDRTSVCWAHREYSVKILEGFDKDDAEKNDAWFAYICQLDACEACREQGQTMPTDGCPDCDQWDDEKVWLKANPGMGTILPIKYLRDQVCEAKGMPSKENLVKRLNFCIWTSTSTRAIPMDKWDACRRTIDHSKLLGRDCYGGLDIGATSDFTAFSLVFPHDDVEHVEVPVDIREPTGHKRALARRSFTLLSWFWLPEHPRKRGEREQRQIDTWRRMGLVRTTPGEVVDYDLVLEDIIAICSDYNLCCIGFDRGFQGSQMGNNLLNHFGERMIREFPQGIISMNAPFREFLELIILGRLHHDGNAVLRWMASNTAAEVRGGLMKPSKDASAEKIDGVVSAVMSLGVAMSGENNQSWYTPGVLLN